MPREFSISCGEWAVLNRDMCTLSRGGNIELTGGITDADFCCNSVKLKSRG